MTKTQVGKNPEEAGLVLITQPALLSPGTNGVVFTLISYNIDQSSTRPRMVRCTI